MPFRRPQLEATPVKDFGYLADDSLYFDSACQTLRPQPVIDAVNEYYTSYNACGERVKYDWGRRVDEKIGRARQAMIRLAGKSEADYDCAFTLNTTYGINLLLSQLPPRTFKRVVVSEIEHNSVFLPSITWAKRLGMERLVLPRQPDGSVQYEPGELERAVVVLNTTSNVDGSCLVNGEQLIKDTHKADGIVILDGAQTAGHDPRILKNLDFDALCFSGHKMYAPSLGVIIIKKRFAEQLRVDYIGGGMVQDVGLDGYTLVPGEPASRLEAGLQNFAGIIGLGAAAAWLRDYRPEGYEQRQRSSYLSVKLFDGLANIDSLRLFNRAPSPIISFYSDKIDAHKLAIYLSARNIMVRSGYFCCHYWLDAKRHMPPLLRVSLGLNNTENQIDELISSISSVLRSR